MRHKKHKTRLGRTLSHRKALLRNMAKSFFMHERIETTVQKAKELRRVVEPLITLAKEDSLTNRRRAIAALAISFNPLSPKEARAVKEGDLSVYNDDRTILRKLFGEIGPKFKARAGGYTRIVRTHTRAGDRASCCIIECVE